MTEIKAAVSRDYSLNVSMETLNIKEPGEGEVLVKLAATGVCHTDIKVATWEGRSPRPVVLGHEGAGVVEAVGPGIHDLEVGDHVVMTFTWCGICPSCRDAHPAYCYTTDHFACTRPDGSTPLTGEKGAVHGDFFNQSSFATYGIGRRNGIVKVRKDAPLNILGPLGCGIQTGAGTVLNIFKMKPGQTIAVFGAGSLGLSAVMAAKISGAGRIIAVDIHDNRLELAKELGANHVLNGRDGPVSDQIKDLLGDGVNFAFDTTTLEPVMQDALKSLARRGTFSYAAGTESGTLTVPLMPMMADKKIIGMLEGDSNPNVFIPQLIDFYMDGKFPFDKLITYYPFEDIEKAFHDSETGQTIKPVLVMDQ